MTDCPYRDDLKAHADGELPWLRRASVRRHLTRCASCREEIAAMKQLTEDLRASEPEDALPSALREKLLAAEPTPPPASQEPTPARSSPTLPKREGEEIKISHPSPSPCPSVSGGPLRSKEVGSRKRPALAWSLAGAALIAWFVCFPLLNKVHEYARRVNPTAASAPKPSQVALSMPQYADPPPPAEKEKPVPPAMAAAPPIAPSGNFTVRLSNREAGTESGQAAGSALSLPDGSLDTLRQVHKEASIGIQVPNPEVTGDTLETMVKETGGYVVANNLSTGTDGQRSGELIVKVPVTQFEPFLAQVSKLGVVQSKNVTGEDITEKTSDADQTEGVLEDDVQQSEVRLKALGAKAKWRDEEATRDLRIQLAQARARLVLLKRMAALGTITIDLSQTPKAAAAPPVTNGFTGSLKATTHDALQSLIGSADALLALVIWLLAYAPIWVPLLLIGRYALKEYRKREAA